MANPSDQKKTTVPPLRHDWAAAFLSFLVPGLGQIFQGRVGKGVLFLVCVYVLFFYGLSLGSWQNVYLPRAKNQPPVTLLGGFNVPKPIAYRVPYLGQFWVGVVAWPALWQFWFYDEKDDRDTPDPVLRKFMRAPTEEESNILQNTGDRTWDLGWVYTVIAGVLNIMVIYDALVGPAFIPGNPDEKGDKDKNKKTGAKDAARR
jgi:TM2 domain-containing membrane protein YozV